MDPTSNATTENSDQMKGTQLESKDSLTSPGTARNAEDDIIARESSHTGTKKEPVMRDPMVQIIDWDSQTSPSQEEECLKRSRYRIGGSADSLLSLTSSQSLLPLEWKILRSSQSQGTLAHFSDVTLESTDVEHQSTMDSNQDVVDDIIGDEVAFKIGTHMHSHNLGAAYSADSRTAFPLVYTGSPSPKEANYPNHSSNDSECIPALCPRTEKFPDGGNQVNQAHISVDQQDSSLIDQLWTAASASIKNFHKAPVSNVWESNSYNHEPTKTEGLPVMSEFQLKFLGENKQEFSQSMTAKTKGQLLLNRQSIHPADDGKLYRKISKIQSRYDPVDIYEQTLHGEICDLRNESRKLREISHQLNEENHRLKEELWDVKRQYEWLMHTVTGKQDEKIQQLSRNNTSLSSLSSESTEFLIAGYCDTSLAKENRDLKDDASEKTRKTNGNNVPCINQHKQINHENYYQNSLLSASGTLSQVDTCNKYNPNRIHMAKTALSRRPFAPRSVADLKVGNMVKFSCPRGKISKGTVKYLGPLFGREEDYLGIELEGDQVGRHDGTFQGTRYFLCAPNKGVFVNFSKIIIAWE